MSEIKRGALVICIRSPNKDIVGKVGEVLRTVNNEERYKGGGYGYERINGYAVKFPFSSIVFGLTRDQLIPINDPDVDVSGVTTKVKEKDNVVPALSAS